MTPRRTIALFSIVTIVACTTQKPVASKTGSTSERERLLSQHNVDAVIYQHSSAEVYRLYQQCYELAAIRLDRNLDKPHAKPPAVIVDIDETVLDNSPFQVTNTAEGRTYSPANWSAWTVKAAANALPGAVEFLNAAARKGCEVFYISNRSEAEKEATIRNLKALSFPTVDAAHVLCMQGGVSDKSDRRDQVRANHYVALLVGDQLRDFDEHFKDRPTGHGRPTVDAMRDTLRDYFIMLPNPMYGTWLDEVAGKADSLKQERKETYFRSERY